MSTLEQITFEAGRSALADQESFVAGVLQRTGTLLAAHALVASFLGASVIREGGLNVAAWIALTALVLGLIAAAILLAPWRLRFTIDAEELYESLYAQANVESNPDGHEWLVSAGCFYQDLREGNAPMITRMSRLSALVGILMVVQTLAWMTALAVD